MRQANAQLRYYFHIDPDTLSDLDWALRWKELLWVRTREAETQRIRNDYTEQ